jgi:predicted peptidase
MINFLKGSKQLTYIAENAENDGNGNKLEVPYLLHLPDGYENMGALPIILFLQCSNTNNNCGSANNGCDGIADSATWPADAVIFQKMIEDGKFPCIIIAPKLYNWCEPEGLNSASGIISGVKKAYNCDAGRVYIIGTACGAYGLYDYIGHAEDTNGIAAAVSIGGAYMCELIENIKKVPLWICYNEDDSNSKEMIETVQKAGGKVQSTDYTNYTNAENHLSFIGEQTELFNWLFAQKRQS